MFIWMHLPQISVLISFNTTFVDKPDYLKITKKVTKWHTLAAVIPIFENKTEKH